MLNRHVVKINVHLMMHRCEEAATSDRFKHEVFQRSSRRRFAGTGVLVPDYQRSAQSSAIGKVHERILGVQGGR